MTATIRWPLRYGCAAIVVVEGDPQDAPLIDPRQAHLPGCRCRACVVSQTSQTPAVDAVREDAR
jgi:hypothetical protein